MKVLLLFIALLSPGLVIGINLHQLIHKIPEKFEKILSVDDGVVRAICNEYSDKLFVNINTWAVNHGLDPIPLLNVSEGFLTAYIDLWGGYLSGISHVNRTDDIALEYSHSTRTINMYFPIVLNNLEFGYDYHVALFLVGPRGQMIGNIDSFPANFQIAFNFTDYQAELVKVSTWGMGEIHIRFEGDPYLDLIADIMSQFVVDVLHPLIEGVINGIVTGVADKVVEIVNEGLDNLLNPNTSADPMITKDFIYERVEQIKLNY